MNRQEFGQFIFEERSRQGLSQLEVATRAGMSRQRVNEMEKNHFNYGVDGLINVLKVLGFDLERIASSAVEPKVIVQESGDGATLENVKEQYPNAVVSRHIMHPVIIEKIGPLETKNKFSFKKVKPLSELKEID